MSRRLPSSASGGQSILLLGGLPSSGTELLALFVNAHPDVTLYGEFPLLARMASRFGPVVCAPDVPRAIAELRRLDIYGCFRTPHSPTDDSGSRTLAELFASLMTSEPTRWVGHKTPQNLENAEAMLQLFPEARFLILIRDARDVALSWQRRWGKDPLMTAEKWNRRIRIGLAALEASCPGRYLVTRYEDLIENPEPVGHTICEFLGVPFDADMLRYHETVEEVIEGKRNYGTPLMPGNKEKWRTQMEPALVRRIEEIAFEGLTRFGYEIDAATATRPITAGERLRGRARDVWSYRFVPGRNVDRPMRHWLRSVRLQLQLRLP